jgi:hypothetical protein
MYLSEASTYLYIEVEHSDLEKTREALKAQKEKEKSTFLKESMDDIK